MSPLKGSDPVPTVKASGGRYARLLTNTAVFTVGKLLSKLLVFCMTRLYTSYLSPSDYSTADLIANMANLLIPLACVGISEGIFRNAAAKEGDKEAFLTNGLAVFGVGSLLFLALSPLLGLLPLFEEESAAISFPGGTTALIVLYVLSSNLHSVVSQYLCAIGRTKLFAGQGILNTALVIGLNLLFLPALGLGVTGYVLSTVIADFLTTVFLFIVTRLWRAIKPRSLSWGTVGAMLRFCLPLVPTTIFWWITGVSDRYMVAEMQSPAMNGLYTAAYKIPTLLIYAVGIFDSAWKLSVSAEEDLEACRAFYSRVWRVYTTVAFLGGAALTLTCRLFAKVLFAETYAEAWVYIPLLTVATVFTALDTFLGSVYFTGRRTMWSMLTALAGAGLNILLNFLWIPVWGAMGASLATLVAYFAVFLLRLATTRRLIPFQQEPLRWMINTALSLLLAGAVTLSGSDRYHGAVVWGAACLLFALLLLVNAKAVMEVLRDAKGILRGRGKSHEP